MKDPLVRFSVAIGGELLRKFDKYRELHRYPNRSEAVRGLMRGALIEETIAHDDSEAMGVVTLIYDHHVSRIARRLTDLQHHHLDRVVTTTHVHLDEKPLPGSDPAPRPGREIRDLADDLIGTKGVETGRLVLASAKPVPAGNSGATSCSSSSRSSSSPSSRPPSAGRRQSQETLIATSALTDLDRVPVVEGVASNLRSTRVESTRHGSRRRAAPAADHRGRKPR